MGRVKLSTKQAQALQVTARTPWSTVMEKCAPSTCAQLSYQQATVQLRMLTGVSVAHSSLQRLVNRTAIPWGRDEQPSSDGSINGGKIRLRGEGDGERAKSHWQDYQAVALSNGLGEAFCQDNEALQAWSSTQPLSQQFRVTGDGHDGVWNIACRLGLEQVEARMEVLGGFYLMENHTRLRCRRLSTNGCAVIGGEGRLSQWREG